LIVKGNNFFAASYGNGLFSSSNNGNTWVEAAANGIVKQDWNRAMIEKDNALFIGNTGGIFKSTDNGANWVAANTGLDILNVASLFVKNNILFAGTDGRGIYKSTDNGATWRSVTPNTTHRVFSLAFDGTNIWAATFGSGIWRSTDDGETWTSVSLGVAGLNIYALTTKGINVFAASQGSGIFKLNNTSTAWTRVNDGLPDLNIRSLITIGGTIIAGGVNGGVFTSNDNGTTWTAMNTGLGYTNILTFYNYNNHLWAGTWGGGVWKRPLSELNLISPVKDLANNALSISPNPVHNFLDIQGLETNMKVSVFNITGQLVAHQPILSNNRLDVSALPEGSYLLKIEDATGSVVRKFVKL
jgi:photosystem II stability/assembly factor-like uncharacterized protein